MSVKLLKCMTEKPAVIPFQFKLTNIKVYSLEEALFHSFHYWKESLDDFTSPEFIRWTADELSLNYIASKIKDIAQIDKMSDRMVKFLSIIDYIDADEITEIREKLLEWEKRLEWERLTDRADYFNASNQPLKAYPLYRRALKLGNDTKIYNNAAICLMKLNNHAEAARLLEKANAIEPENTQVYLNLIEAVIYDHQFERAAGLLGEAEKKADAGDIFYLYGELNYEAGNFLHAATFYEKALAKSGDVFYSYRLAEIYVKLRFFDQALEVLDQITVKDHIFLMKQADIYAACNNLPAAIKCIEKALFTEKDNVRLWVKLAQFHRLNYDITLADMAIKKALGLEPENEEALLENARIKKQTGKTREYQTVLKSILQSFKKRYRNMEMDI